MILLLQQIANLFLHRLLATREHLVRVTYTHQTINSVIKGLPS